MAREQRKLAAIVCADVVGYSRLIGADEAGTLARLRALRQELVDPNLAAHGGRIVKTMGDGLLIEFGSVVDAVRAAVAVQQAIARRESALPEDRRISMRIGVHMGDIVVDGDDILGDGVNIAARLEALAEPGGVCVSGRVQEDLTGKFDLDLHDCGEQELKNISRAVRVWRWSPEDAEATQGTVTTPMFRDSPLAPPDKPSIAVLPFQNMSGDPEQEYFVDGLVEDIITALSRFKSLFVIARNSSFTYKGKAVDVRQVGRELGVRYVLEGSVRKAGGRVRITAQLVDTDGGGHHWAERFEGAVEDIFDLQDRITEQVVSVLAPRIELAEIMRVRRKPASNLDAYDTYLRGLALCYPMSRATLDDAVRLLRRATELDPGFAPPYGLLLICLAGRRAMGLIDAIEAEREEISQLAPIAVRVGADDAQTLSYTAWATGYVLRDLSAAKTLIERACALNPNLAYAWTISGWISLWMGLPKVGIEQLRRAMQHDPQRSLANQSVRVAMALTCFFLERYDEAISWAEDILHDDPQLHPALRVAAASAGLAGRVDVAQRMRELLIRVDPAFRVSRSPIYLSPFTPKQLAKYTEGLRLAGFPE